MAKTHLRWKKNPVETGLRAVAVDSSRRGSKLHDGEHEYASVYGLGYHWTSRRSNGWYWVASGGVPYMNTCNSPVSTEEEAKADAMAYVKQHLAKATNQQGNNHD